ncbi:hypothetical protein WA026_019343 [Henosepilachna vigintioctopunctata]|uniref:CHK kinase-like domain-containing protein n=1 Tax=Henosepilachna vigintioctopunctata TaxID=420089 RepID=A0AAW1UAD5_9CUCU
MNDETFELLTEKDCCKILEQHVSADTHLVNYKIYKANSKVVGYMGDHFRLKIFYQDYLKNTVQELKFFVKCKPIINKRQADYENETGFFKKECLLYQNILPKLSALTDVQLSPRCYLANKKCLVMEDLMNRNFASKRSYLNLEECESLVRCLAKFHCASIVFEELYSFNGNKFRLNQLFKEEFKEIAFSFVEGQPRNKWLKTTTECVIQCIKFLQLANTHNINEKLKYVAFNGMETFISPSEKFRNVVTHSDLWCNNFMMNDDLECLLIDFQLARYNPPAYDLLLSLYLNTTKDFLEENMENLLELYYITFKNMLLQYKITPEEVFPKKRFLESIEYFKLPAVLEAVYFATNTLISPETSEYVMADAERYHEFIFVNRSKYILEEFGKNSSFKSGLLQVLIPLIDILQKTDVKQILFT